VLASGHFGVEWYHESSAYSYARAVRIVCVRESRVTGILSHVLIGLSVLFIEQLKLIPRPVLDGLFLYLAVTGARGRSLLSSLGHTGSGVCYHGAESAVIIGHRGGACYHYQGTGAESAVIIGHRGGVCYHYQGTGAESAVIIEHRGGVCYHYQGPGADSAVNIGARGRSLLSSLGTGAESAIITRARGRILLSWGQSLRPSLGTEAEYDIITRTRGRSLL